MSKHSHIISRVASSTHDFYLSGAIGSPSNYVEWYDTIRKAAEEDTIVMHINSPGGQIYTTIQLLRAIADSEAHIVTSIEGECCSAATLIFLAGDSFEVSPHSIFMAHDYTSGMWGEGHKLASRANFDATWFDNLAKDVYRNFLSDAEIGQVLLGQDLWLTSEQVTERCIKLQEIRMAEHREQC